MVPCHARPVVDPLQRKVNVFIGFEFNYAEAAFASKRQYVDHSAIRGKEGGHLRIAEAWIQLAIERGDILNDQRLQPTLGMQPPPAAFPGTVRVANFADAADESLKCLQVAVV